MSKPFLSIIVPVLNEAAVLEPLLTDLARQEFVEFEVILCDGGSTDDSEAIISSFQQRSPYRIRLVTSSPGRAVQMNLGARQAAGEWLLFLHADSQFDEPRTLMLALAAIQRETELQDLPPCAGHFSLRFKREQNDYPFAYYYYEAKSRLDLPDCVHGDQGYLMHRDVFRRTGGFDESLPLLEDCAMADTIAHFGRWVLLPGCLLTSARRFEVEGMPQRQTLNAMIMNFRHIGWADFFDKLPQFYSSQDRSAPLRLLLVWGAIRKLLGRVPLFDRLHIWYATGGYVRSQAWQLLFAWHCYRQFRRGQVTTMGRIEIQTGMRGFERVFDNPPGRLITAILVWLWFSFVYVWLLLRDRG